MLTWAWKEEIPIHAFWTVPSFLQEGAEESSRGPTVLIRGLASRQEAGIHIAGLKLPIIFPAWERGPRYYLLSTAWT